ncbi:MAG: hypothetical protein NC111_03210 [Bacteroides sp.]|nr:hypothetical protein [Bacteroides sp.]MCM1412855.1 hypothetical protein [Bacteroides sp.]MCM1471524.1 hypothetical protein [Bacteroides sp.]
MKRKLVIVGVLLCGFFGGMVVGCLRSCGSRAEGGGSVVCTTLIDTVSVMDTVRVAVPMAVDQRVVRSDTVRLAMVADGDTAVIATDSVAVMLPMLQRHFQGEEYEAWVSGYDPQIDSIILYRPLTTVRETTLIHRDKGLRGRWGLSAGIGVALSIDCRVRPAVFVGLSYTFVAL